MLHFESKIFLGKIQLPLVNCFFLFLTLASSCTQGPDLTDTKVCLTYYKRKPFLFLFAKWKQTLAKVKKKATTAFFFVMVVFSSFHWRSTTPIKCKLWSTSLWSVTSWGWDKTWCSWGQGGLMFPAPRIGINRPQIQSEHPTVGWLTGCPPILDDDYPTAKVTTTTTNEWFLVVSLVLMANRIHRATLWAPVSAAVPAVRWPQNL